MGWVPGSTRTLTCPRSDPRSERLREAYIISSYLEYAIDVAQLSR